MRFCYWSFFVVAILFFSSAQGAVTTASFQGLGFLQGGTSSSSAGASRSGQFVFGGAQTSSGSYLTYVWSSSTGMVSLGQYPDGATSGGPWAISDNASVVVGEYYTPTNKAFRWTTASGMQPLGSIDGRTFNRAFAVSADGSVVYGDAESDSGNEAFRWTQATGMVGLGYPTGYPLSIAHATSADGSVMAGRGQTDHAIDAFRWTAADGFKMLPGMTLALAMSSDGSVIVGSSGIGPEKPALWTAATGTIVLGSVSGVAESVSADGSVVAGYLSSGGFVWDAGHGVRSIKSLLLSYNLDVSGWQFQDAWVGGDGVTFTGTGIDPAGHQEAWVAVVPEPGAAGVILIIAGTIVMRRKRIETP